MRCSYGPAMISALVRVSHGIDALAATLTALVPAVTEGFVGDAVVLIPRPDDDVAPIADAVGAALVVAGPDDPWRPGAKAARHEWILCLDDGDIPSAGWIRALERFVTQATPERRFGRLGRRLPTLGARLVEVRRRVAMRPRIGPGDLVHRSLLTGSTRPAHRPVWLGPLIERDPLVR